MRIFADFDGTIALPDVTDLVLGCLAAPEWEAIETAWLNGEIDAATCMRRQIALIEASPSALNAVLDGVSLDPHFHTFARWCEASHIKLSIVSDGVDHFIQRILDKHGLGQIPVFANELRGASNRFELLHPWSSPGCAARQGVCKCAVVEESIAPLIYVGDGRSDECVALRANVLFAKGKLAAFCTKRGLPFIPFETFADVQAALSSSTGPLALSALRGASLIPAIPNEAT